MKHQAESRHTAAEAPPRYPYLLVEVSEEQREWVGAELFEQGATGIEERDSSTLLRGEGDATLLLAHFDDRITAEMAQESIGDHAKCHLAFIEGDDWRDAWKAFFRPLRAGKRLWVRPPWEHLDLATGEHAIVMDPGRAFGSGMHETTQLVLREIDQRIRGGERVLDVGTGSGILAIGALLLGAKSAEGTEIDADALAVAVENATINGVGERYHGHRAAELDQLIDRAVLTTGYDLVLANIQRAVLVPLAPKLIRATCSTTAGTLVLSGVLRAEEDEVREAFAALPLRNIARQGDWSALVLGTPSA